MIYLHSVRSAPSGFQLSQLPQQQLNTVSGPSRACHNAVPGPLSMPVSLWLCHSAHDIRGAIRRAVDQPADRGTGQQPDDLRCVRDAPGKGRNDVKLRELESGHRADNAENQVPLETPRQCRSGVLSAFGAMPGSLSVSPMIAPIADLLADAGSDAGYQQPKPTN